MKREPNLSYDDPEMDDYDAMYPPKLPLWKGSLFVLTFGLIVKYWANVLQFINSLL